MITDHTTMWAMLELFQFHRNDLFFVIDGNKMMHIYIKLEKKI